MSEAKAPNVVILDDTGRVVARVPVKSVKLTTLIEGLPDDCALVWAPGAPLDPVLRVEHEFEFTMTPEGQEFARRVSAAFNVPDALVGLPTPWWRRWWQRLTRRA